MIEVYAEEARKIWEEEISLKAQWFIEFIKKMILQYTYQDNAFLYAFDFPDFIKRVQGDDKQQVSDEFIQAVLEKVISYFENLGFKVKADRKYFRVWITYLKSKSLERDSFTEKLINIINVRQNHRTFTGIDEISADILSQIRENANRRRDILYPVTLNIANKKSLLLEDLLEIIDRLEKLGYMVSIEGLTNGNLDNRESILKAVYAGMCFEKLEVSLIIKW